MSKGKEKEITPPQPFRLIQPASGSANPAATLSSLWAYLVPALDHIVRSSTNNVDKAPAVDVEFYAGIHSACYNYITSQTEAYNNSGRKNGSETPMSGTDLYDQLDKYFSDTARELLLGAPQDDSTLIHYIIPCFNRYSLGAQSANRLLNYVNRHYVKRAIDEDRGWLSINDLLDHVAKTMTANDSREKLSTRMKEKKMAELGKWGYADGGPGELLAQAEASAEAASSPDRIVPINSLAHRRFRTEFIEPLLAVPKLNGGKKAKKKLPAKSVTSAPPGPKGRLARSVKELLESQDVDVVEREKLAVELARTLRIVGVRTDHPLRKRLDKFVAASSCPG